MRTAATPIASRNLRLIMGLLLRRASYAGGRSIARGYRAKLHEEKGATVLLWCCQSRSGRRGYQRRRLALDTRGSTSKAIFQDDEGRRYERSSAGGADDA